ncbi:TetR/AcrR family transcriptional regulator [Amycolatopsis jiangsuensis]|uniref:AcrR family transcriptional regulator n=1 Tax=Amycolatopsis jiangsuensis TaxID=1181879 RepID=A0A840J5L1_9PSEU|nr:TetR/AcrR family transcriptional regulator [Amycolatopsis jiangsuensis]MBB4689083.1 AcrR family transcriptional regulator [Amycolatopsis jiangsuensis]
MVGNADKRQHILDVATRLAGTDGLRGLSVRSVASAAGIGATTLRAYFPSQALLYQAVAEQLVSFALSDDPIHDTSKPPVDRLYASLRQFLPVPANRRGSLLLWLELLTLALGPDANDEVLQMMLSGREESVAIARRWFTALAEDGCTLRDTPEALAGRFSTLVDGLQLGLLFDQEEAALDRAEDMLRWFAEQSLVTPADENAGQR